MCQNYSSVPECICADGYAGEDICTGTSLINRSILSLKCLAVLRDSAQSYKKLVNWEALRRQTVVWLLLVVGNRRNLC